MAVFKVPYQEGTIQAITYEEEGKELERTELQTASGTKKLLIAPETNNITGM